MADEKKEAPANANYKNKVSGAIVSGTVYNKMNKKLKSRYVKVKEAPKKAKPTPPEAK